MGNHRRRTARGSISLAVSAAADAGGDVRQLDVAVILSTVTTIVVYFSIVLAWTLIAIVVSLPDRHSGRCSSRYLRRRPPVPASGSGTKGATPSAR